MRLTAVKTEYDLPSDFSKIANVYVIIEGRYLMVSELPQTIPQSVDMSHLVRAERDRRETYPKESVPVAFTVYAPKRRRKKSTIVLIPAPSKNWKLEVEYYAMRRA